MIKYLSINKKKKYHVVEGIKTLCGMWTIKADNLTSGPEGKEMCARCKRSVAKRHKKPNG